MTFSALIRINVTYLLFFEIFRKEVQTAIAFTCHTERSPGCCPQRKTLGNDTTANSICKKIFSTFFGYGTVFPVKYASVSTYAAHFFCGRRARAQSARCRQNPVLDLHESGKIFLDFFGSVKCRQRKNILFIMTIWTQVHAKTSA